MSDVRAGDDGSCTLLPQEATRLFQVTDVKLCVCVCVCVCVCGADGPTAMTACS